jgi:hypothetical protein
MRSYLLRCMLLAAALGGAWLAGAPALAARGDHPAHPAELAIDAPDSAQVGSAVEVTVIAPGTDNDAAIHLIALGGAGTRVYQATAGNDRARFTLPADDTRHAGMLRLVASVGKQQTTAAVELLPGAPVGPLVPLVGPRSITANGKDRSMITVLLTDEHGNPTAEDTPVRIRALQPGGGFTSQTVRTAHLLAWAWLESGTRAGRTTVVVTAEDAYGPEATLLEVAGRPAPFTVTAIPATLPADGRQLVTLRTDTLRDRYGNILPDGMLVTFIVESPDGTRRSIPAQIIDGAAEAPLQAPRTPGRLTIWATLYGSESEPVSVTFTPGPAVDDIPLAAEIDTEAGTLLLEAGPLLGAQGQYVPDGTPVQFSLIDVDGQRQQMSGSAENGYASVMVRLAALAPGRYTVAGTVGSGHGETTIRVP